MSELNKWLPGRLSDDSASLVEDPRLDPRIAAALNMAGELAPGVEEVASNADYESALAYCQAFEDAAAAANPLLEAAMPEFAGVASAVEVISGVDDNEIKLFIDRPANASDKRPCIVHFHGGGMVLMTAEDPGFVRWRKFLAELGLVVVGVEFRNGGGRLGNHPFPAGLNDCASAVQWVHANKESLGISSLVLSGESGGGNLSIATALKANQEGWIDQVDGVYAMCPYISGAYAEPPAELLSLRENDDYLLSGATMSALARVYDPSGEQANNPLAWPWRAEVSALQGLPPHVISVNELDPLRDEGLAYYRKLMAAGVSAVGQTVHGTPHAGDLMYPDVNPEVYAQTARSLLGFANALQG